MKQLILIRKDLKLSPIDLAVLVHKTAFEYIKAQWDRTYNWVLDDKSVEDYGSREFPLFIDMNVEEFRSWIEPSCSPTICESRNAKDLLKAVDLAEQNGLILGIDLFIIGTEEEPLAIGFKPLQEDKIKPVMKKYKLYKE